MRDGKRHRYAAQVMRRLRGSLNVAQLKGAFEDATDVHIVMEWCKGGELWHRIGRAHYSERTVGALSCIQQRLACGAQTWPTNRTASLATPTPHPACKAAAPCSAL
jgi:serine/threonine protein kinase